MRDLVVRNPQVYLLVRPDGSTNVPPPLLKPESPIAELLRFDVRRFQLLHGSLQLNDARYPLDVRGENLALVLRYHASHYHLDLSSKSVYARADCCRPFPVDLAARAVLRLDTIDLHQLSLHGSQFNAEISGKISRLRHPVADLHFEAKSGATAIAAILGWQHLSGGDVGASGDAHYESYSGLKMVGRLQGRNLGYRSKAFSIERVNFVSAFQSLQNTFSLDDISAECAGAKFSGRATLRHFRDLQANGNIASLNLRQVAQLILQRPVPWSAWLEGPMTVSGDFARPLSEFAVTSDLQLAPASGGMPLTGEVNLSGSLAAGVHFTNSHLELPHTRLEFSRLTNNRLDVALHTDDLNDIKPAIAFFKPRSDLSEFPVLLPGGGRADFKGAVIGPLQNPIIDGHVALTHFTAHGEAWDSAASDLTVSPKTAEFASFSLERGASRAVAHANLNLSDWAIVRSAPIAVAASFHNVALHDVLARSQFQHLHSLRGSASGTIDISGSLDNPAAVSHLTLDQVNIDNQHLSRLRADAELQGNELHFSHGVLEAAGTRVTFSGSYLRLPASWREGQFSLRLDADKFPLAYGPITQDLAPGLNGSLDIHAQVAGRLTHGTVVPAKANGNLAFRNLIAGAVPLGNLFAVASTRGSTMDVLLTGDVRHSDLHGEAQIDLAGGTRVQGDVHFGKVRLPVADAILSHWSTRPIPIDGFVEGGLSFAGSLENPSSIYGSIRLDALQIEPKAPIAVGPATNPVNFSLRNSGPILLDASGGTVTIRRLNLSGENTSLVVAGSFDYRKQDRLQLSADGSLDMKLLSMFDSRLQSSGQSQLRLSLGGTFISPVLAGTVEVRNGSLSMPNLSNGLSALNGTVAFNGDRATIQTLTAETGGGHLALTGFVGYGAGPLVYHLESRADNVRIRYASSISVAADANLRLSGTSANSILSGTATISRVVLNTGTDVGNVLAGFSAPAPVAANKKDLLTGLRLDVNVQSSPNMQLSTSLSQDVEADIDLRLRGTLDRPVLLGDISANQGDIRVFGTRYSINRGQVSFANNIKIDPILDLDLQTDARGITVDITISGTLNKLNVTYRSDPPLQPRDIIALLTVGRAPDTVSNVQNIQVANDTSGLQSGANSVLGQAISPVSNRLSKLFGVTNIKIDPLVQGITNTPQARFTLQQQISRAITVTYVTNLSQTSEQIFRVEWSLNRQYSVVAVRDDNGEFGIDFQYKKRFK